MKHEGMLVEDFLGKREIIEKFQVYKRNV